jgi:signal transduction histidine kinase/DNA-binding response OmpR family regulator
MMMTKWYRYWEKKSVEAQFSVLFIVAMGCLALFASMVNSITVANEMRSYIQHQGVKIVESLAKQSGLALLSHSPENAHDVIEATLAFPGVVAVEITDIKRKVLVSKINALKKAEESSFFRPQRVSESNINHPLAISHVFSGEIGNGRLVNETEQAWYFGAPVTVGKNEDSPYEMEETKPETIGYVYVVVEKSELDQLVCTLRFLNVVMTIAFSVILICMLRLIAKKIAAPLSTLSGLMKRAEKGEHGIRAELKGSDDVMAMASAFNTMMEGLEQRELELVRSRDEAVQLAQIKSRFASTVSHELRTPLNGVIGTLDMLKGLLTTAGQHEYADIAWRSSHSLLELVNNILDFSKMEAGKIELECLPFDLWLLIEDVMELFAKQAQEKSLDLGYVMPLGFPLLIKGDALRLRQILMNLVGNALKFTEKGEVAVLINSEPQEHSSLLLHIDICDTGIGMNEQAVEHIFESFTQADNSTTRKYGGTGLGLAISKQLAQLMGGDITVRSVLGQGTTFRVSIRLNHADEQELAQHSSTRKSIPMQINPSGEPHRVLVLDPSPVVHAFIERTLSELGCIVHIAFSVKELIDHDERLKKEGHTLHALFMDKKVIQAEEGHAFLKTIRDERGQARWPVLVALDRTTRLAGMPPYGFDQVLAKPIRLNRLVECMRALREEQAPTLSASTKLLSVAETLLQHNELKKSPILQKESPPLPIEPVWGELSIMLADDNKTNRLVAGRMLQNLGCKVTLAEDGKQALDATIEQSFDLILMDCSMPEMDGYEATRQIRLLEQQSGGHTPIVALTANTQPGDKELCLTSGMDDYLSKPVTINVLKAKLMEWLQCEVKPPETVSNASLFRVENASSYDEALERSLFNALLEELSGTLEQSITRFLQTIEDSVYQLEEAIQQGELKTSKELIESMKHVQQNISMQVLNKVLNDTSNPLPERVEWIIKRLRQAFVEVSSMIR